MTRRLTVALPDDVWDRLDAEAADHGKTIGAYLKQLIITRDAKRQARTTK